MFVLLLLIPQGFVPLALPPFGTAPVNSIVEVYVVGTLLEDLTQIAVHIIWILLGCLDRRSADRWKIGSSAPGQQRLQLS